MFSHFLISFSIVGQARKSKLFRVGQAICLKLDFQQHIKMFGGKNFETKAHGPFFHDS
jgi:hypothetical protein